LAGAVVRIGVLSMAGLLPVAAWYSKLHYLGR
jgi:hypothetical protein